MIQIDQTAATIARVAASLVRETRAAHAYLLCQAHQPQVYHYNVIKNVGRVQLAISTSYIAVDDDIIHQVLHDGQGHALIASSVSGGRLPRPMFEIVTRRRGRIKRRSGYRFWLAANGDSMFLSEQPGRPAWWIDDARLVCADAVALCDTERREGFARGDRMLRRIARDA